jgi:hypothetical protein
MSSIGQKIKHEFEELIPPTIFFFVAFQLLAFTQAMMLRQYGIEVSVFVAATVGALVVAKVVLLADLWPMINRFPDRPLIYNVLWKTAVYFTAALGVRYLEKLIHFWRELGSMGAANRELVEKIVWPHFWVVQTWLLVLLLVYCSLRELVRALGRERVLQMFFGRPVGTLEGAVGRKHSL